MSDALSPHLASSCGQRLGREPRRVPTDTELRESIAREAGGAAGGYCAVPAGSSTRPPAPTLAPSRAVSRGVSVAAMS